MNSIVLKQEILDKVKSDADLFAGVAKALFISPSSLPNFLNRNDARLTQASVLKVIRDHLGVEQDSELLTELEVTE